MLRAYRKTFMGTIREQWQKLPDLRPGLRVPVILLAAALLCYGLFSQTLVRFVAPKFRNYLSADGTDTLKMQTCSHGAVRRPDSLALSHKDGPQRRGYSIR
jgi:NADH:ubiquinone oxidoreductase subunit 4 (subunit M)